MDRVLPGPVVEDLAAADVLRITLGRRVGQRRMRLLHDFQRRHEIPVVARRPLRREEDLEGAVGIDLDRRRIDPARLGLHAGAQLLERPRIAGEAAPARLEDHVMRRLAARGRGRHTLPMARVAHLAAQAIGLAAVDRRREVDRVGIVDRAARDDRERVAEMRAHGVLVEDALDGVVHEAHQVAVALGEIAIARRRRHQLRLVDRVARFAEQRDHVVPGRAQFLLGLRGVSRVGRRICLAHVGLPCIDIRIRRHASQSKRSKSSARFLRIASGSRPNSSRL